MNAKHYYLSVLLLLVATLGLRAQSKTVTLTEAGTLSNFISEAEQTTITDLTIKGPINSADIITLRGMAGNLKVLNLLDANIVYSAQSYYGGNSEYHTQNDVVGDYMFYGMTKLTKVTLPKDVWSIGSWSLDDPWNEEKTHVICDYPMGGGNSFSRCINLEEVVLPTGILYIGTRTFDYCLKLTIINLPEGLEVIDDYAFYNCQALKKIKIPASFGTQQKLIGKYTDNGSRTFDACTNLSDITISSGVTSLSSYMFAGCTALENITLPDGLLSLNSAFSNCSALKTISIPSSVTSIGNFIGCSSLTELHIPDGVTELEQSIFHNCSSLTVVSLPANLQNIPAYAFKGCTALSSIAIPNKVTSIDKEAFKGCSALKSITFSNELTSILNYAFSECVSLESITLPSKLLTMGEYVFSGCTKLISITLPQSLSEIGSYAFADCMQLSTIKLPTVLMCIKKYTFQNCVKLEAIELPIGLMTIEQYAFSGCKSLKKITIPGSVQTISSGAFKNCGLQEIVLSEGIITLENGIFSGCNLLEKVTIPASMKVISGFSSSGIKILAFAEDAAPESIGGKAFYECDSLRTLTLPNSITTIGSGAFYGCNNLRSIILPEKITKIPNEAFRACKNLSSLTIPEGVTEIGESAFADSGIKSITIPQGVTVIANVTFGYCDSLVTVNLPNTIVEIGGHAFRDCPNLKMESLPTSLNKIGEWAFREGGQFSSLVIPSGVTSIPENAFSNVVFGDLTIPETVTTIEEGAFVSAEIKNILTINPAPNLSIDFYNSFNCSGNKEDASGNLYNYHLNTVNWNSTTPFPRNKFCEIDYLYLPEGGSTDGDYDIGYIFYNGITDSIAVAATYNNGRNAYEVKQPMKTRKVTYEKHFDVTSGFGEAAGWKTLVLPFAPTKITHTRGYGESQETVTLAPFGSKDLETEGVLPFWLYELGTDGNYKAATAIEANKAYLICMPNNNAYPSENNISGDVLFMAEDATNGITLGVTEGALKPSTGTKFDLVPTYETVERGLNVYALNEDSRYYADDKTYPYGSVFVQDFEDIQPFQAYLVSKEAQAGTLNAVRYYAIGGGDGTITGIEDGPAMPDQATRAYSRGGVLYIQTNADRTIYIYNVKGQTVRIVNAHEGLNEVRGLEEGIYMLEGQKVVVK